MVQCSLPSLFNEPFTDSIDYTDVQRAEMIYLVGCCNGLVCILLDLTTFILWNPATKKSMNLPHFDNNKLMHGSIMKYGFGFDELNDDFKVFGSRHLYATDGTRHTIGKDYSLRSNSWTLYVNGKLHWEKHDKREIVSFDLSSHVSRVVELPSSYSDVRFRFMSSLGVHKGCLITHAFHPNTHFDIWVMKEYGAKESWDKVTTVLYFDDPHGYSVAIAPNGDILLNYDSSFAIYNPKSNVLLRSSNPTSRRRNGTIPSPLPQKAISSTTDVSTKLNSKENLSGKSYLNMDKRSTTSCSILSAQASSFLKRETDPTSKIWRYSGRSKGMGNDTNASTRSFSLASSKRMSMETKDAKEASAMKGSLQSSMSSENSSWASPGTCLSTQTLRPSGLRPPSPLSRFSRENSAPSYNGETRTRKLPQKVISKGTTFGCSTQSDSACKKLKAPCSDVPKNIKRPKIESSNTSQVMKYGGAVDQESGMKKKLSYSFDHLENLSRYFEAIDLNQGKRVDRPNKIDVENHGVPVPSLFKRENQLLKSLVSSSKACQMRTPLSDKTFSCNFSGTSMECKRGKSAKKASSVYATSKVLDKENI
ncbi:hypothetical protein ACS0TY_004890 [Phlomoides rotata]